MNLDLLISKYLDGELTIEEDIELRNRLKNNIDEKEEFDSAIILTDAIKQDAESIHLPENLSNATEDKILMKILANMPIVEENPIRFNLKKFAFALAIIIFLFLNIFRIDDLLKMDYSSNINYALNQIRSELVNQQNETMPIVTMTLPNTKRNVKTYASNRNLIKVINSDISNNKATNNYTNSNINTNTLIELNKENIIEITSKNINKIVDSINNDDYFAEVIFNPTKYTIFNNNLNSFDKILVPKLNNPILVDPVFNNNLSNSFNFYNKFELGKIELSSFFGTDISRNGFNVDKNTAITHFSQSLAYSINQNDKLGIEFGYTQYSYTGNIMVNVPINSQPNNNIKENPEIGHGQDEFISVPFPVSQKKQILWASTFYENTFLNYSDLSLNARLAIGGSNDGPLSYGRLFANYEFFRGISATFGAEGRLFFAQIPDINNSEKIIKSTFSLIYGLQIIF